MRRISQNIFLVSCVKTKKKTRTPLPAKTLYCSSWFKKAREYVEAHQQSCWFILSAKHHLVKPNQRIRTYEKTLLNMSAPDRRKWAEHVFSQLSKICRSGDTVSILAGNRYREHLVSKLNDHGCKVKIPMKKMGSFMQGRWLKRALKKIAKT